MRPPMLIAIALLATAACSPESDSAPPPILNVTVADLEKAYDDNEVAAQQRFNGYWLRVVGVVTVIALDHQDEPFIRLEGEGFDVGASFTPDGGIDAAKLTKGKKVRLLCGTVSEVLGNPDLNDCIVENYERP